MRLESAYRGTAAGFLVVIALAAVLGAGTARAADAQRGRELYESYCGGCHYERVHERSPERTGIRTLEALRAEVTRWAGETRQRLAREDIEDIVAYLNRSHYHLSR